MASNEAVRLSGETAASPATPVRRGFGPLPCPRCEADTAVNLCLYDLDDPEACTCAECGEHFSLDAVRDLIRHWGPVLAWCDRAPALPAE